MENKIEILNNYRESKYPMTEMTEAFKLLEIEFLKISKITIEIDVRKAEEYVTSENVESPNNIPIFPTSMMDGYSINLEETDFNQKIEILSKNFAGDEKKIDLNNLIRNKCVYVTTGSIIPSWCNCVIPIENTDIFDNNFIKIKNSSQLMIGKFIRKIGSDIVKGDIIINAGQKINVTDISLLLSCGIKYIMVYAKPRVGILSTGDEILNIDNFSKNEDIVQYFLKNPHQIIDSNKEMIKLLLTKMKISQIIDLGQIPDEYKRVKEKMENSALLCDIVISSGGVSMGEKDLIKVFLEKEGKIFFGRLNMKPGKPTTFAKFYNTYFFALPGNPVSCYVTYQLLLTYAFNLYQNYNKFFFPNINVSIMHDIEMDFERPEYQRAM